MIENKAAVISKGRSNKYDEFYTQYKDVENEMRHYDFKGKSVYCPCDDPTKSNFSKYFRDNFEKLGLRRLVSTCYPNGIMEVVDSKGIKTLKLKGDGDFRSEECKRILRNSDVVVTNPPFSLSRDFFDFVVSEGKEFLIIAPNHAITYPNVLKIFMEKKVWLGVSTLADVWYIVPNEYESKSTKVEGGVKMARFNNTKWHTNMESDTPKHLPLTKTIDDGYGYYDDSDILDVRKTKDIPIGYEGVMGVPICFTSYYNPNEFDIEGIIRPKVDGKKLFVHLLVKHRRTTV